MKRSGSDWDLEELLGPMDDGWEDAGGGEIEDESPLVSVLETLLNPRAAQRSRVCCGGGGGGGGGAGLPFSDVFGRDMGFGFAGNRDAINSHSTGGPLTGSNFWSQNLTSRLSSISSTIESQLSICAGSPTSVHNPKCIENQAPGGTSDSDQSDDDESFDTETGPCGQSTNVNDLKRKRRMVSNRESARRSRKRKQAHLADLELQVDQLRGENSTLYKQLTDANQQFGDAATDNRVLKSDVEALRVKVKMAEDLVTRGSLTCGLDHLIQNHIGPTQLLAARHLCRASESPPILGLRADEACYTNALAAGQVENNGIANNETKGGNGRIRLNQSLPLQSIASMENLQSRISSDITSCVTDMWPWDSQPSTMSKPL